MKIRKYLFFLIFIGFSFYAAIHPSKAQQVTLLFAGDAMQHQTQIDHAYRNGHYDYSSYFKYVTSEISRADLAIVNLEVTLGGKPYKGYPMFSAPDSFAVALKNAGFDLFLTANNHAIDRYSKGIDRTIRVLDSLDVKHTGTFRNKQEYEQFYPLMITKNGIRMAFLNYTYGTNGMKASLPCFVNYIDKEQIQKDIKMARELKADIIIANIHWGQEYKLVQEKEQENLAKFLMDEGVGLIIGSHPHVVQPSKMIKDLTEKASHVVVYSLGNFVSGMKAVNTDGGQMIRIVLSKEGFKTQIRSCAYSLVYMHKEKNEKKIDYTLIPVSQAEKTNAPLSSPLIELDSDSYRSMMIFTRNARNLFSRYNQNIQEYIFENNDFQDNPFYKNMPVKFGD